MNSEAPTLVFELVEIFFILDHGQRVAENHALSAIGQFDGLSRVGHMRRTDTVTPRRRDEVVSQKAGNGILPSRRHRGIHEVVDFVDAW